MKRFFRLVLSLLISFFVLSVNAQVVFGAEVIPPVETVQPTIVQTNQPINLTLSPVTLQFDIKPGETQTAEVKIHNNGNEAEQLRASFGTFRFNQNTQEIDLSEQVQGPEKEWIIINEPQFIVGPSEWKTLKVTFAPPEGAALTYYYALIFSRVNKATAESGATQVSGSPAILVLTNVQTPLAKRELQVEQFFAKQFWVEFLPQTFTLHIKNSGNVHLIPSGNIFIDGPGKKDLAVLSINPNNSVVLPNSSREFQIEWSEGFPKRAPKSLKEQSSEKHDETELAWDFSQADKFRIGKYTAHLLMVYDNGERDIPVESSITFWVIPWRIGVAILVFCMSIMIIGVLLYLLITKVLMRKKE